MSLADLFRNEPDIILFAKGDMVFSSGDSADAMYVIIDGEVDSRIGETSLGIAHRGEIVGEMALVDHRPRTTSVVALTAARLARIDERRFLHLIQNTPTFALDVMTVMASRTGRLDAATEPHGSPTS